VDLLATLELNQLALIIAMKYMLLRLAHQVAIQPEAHRRVLEQILVQMDNL
jgi:hypothetical protein